MNKVKILGNLLTAQGIMASLPNEERVLEFLCQAIQYIPGVADINACWSLKLIVSSSIMDIPCEKCHEPNDYSSCTFLIKSFEKVVSIPLRIKGQHFGVINILEDDSGEFQYFKPHVLNTINVALTILENRRLLKDLERENERHFLALVSSIPGAIYRFKYENTWAIKFLSDDIIKISGYPASDFINGSIAKLIDIVHPDDRFNLRRIVSKAIEKKIPFIMDYRIIHSDGSIRWVHERGQGVTTADGEIKYLEGVVFDITKRKQDEAKLIEARNRAENASRAKTEFLANMSHELRTPLNGILGYAQVLQLSDGISEEQKQYAGIIRQSGEYLLSLIEGLLDYSKIETEMLEVYKQSFSIIQLLKDIADIFNLRVKEKGIFFEFEAPPDLPEAVYGDEKLLRQILINLLSNAVKFTDHGKVWLNVNFDDNIIHLEVGDTGCGIKEEDFKKIFEPFQQLDHHFCYQGTGLGLSICKKLVDILEGQLEIQSKIDQGSVFKVCFSLPAVPILKDSEKPLECILPYQVVHSKILIVDDNRDNLMMLSRLLSTIGFRVSIASSGQECLKQVKSFKPDVVLMDIVMPEMDGLETSRQLRGTRLGGNLIIIALSANADKKNREESMAAGCNDFLSKPVDLEELLKCLQNQFAAIDRPPRKENVKTNIKQASLPPVSILVADDNEINRMLIGAQLTNIRANLTEAKDGIEALALIKKFSFDLILLDLNMPGMGGKEVMQCLRKNTITLNTNTPVIAITAHASPEQLASLSDIGFSDCLIKPILEEQLNKMISYYYPENRQDNCR